MWIRNGCAAKPRFPAPSRTVFCCSLVAGVRPPNFPVVEDAGLVLTTRIDRLRFINPVFAGASVRYLIEVAAVEPRDGGRMLLRQNATLEVLGQPEPALVAQLLAMYVPQNRGTS